MIYQIYCCNEDVTDELVEEYSNKKQAIQFIKKELNKDWWRVDLNVYDEEYGECTTTIYRN